MLIALSKESEAPYVDKMPSAEEMKKYLIRNIRSITVEDRKHLGNAIIVNDCKDKLKECNEGLVINLDSIDNYLLEQLYDILYHKIQQLKI